MTTQEVAARTYASGIGDAVADRTVNRLVFTDTQVSYLPEDRVLHLNDSDKSDPVFLAWMKAAESSGYTVLRSSTGITPAYKPEVRRETWADVAERVAEGNVGLVDVDQTTPGEFAVLRKHLRQASLLLSGRHLQHGDRRQRDRPMEVFTNCSTAAATFVSFYLLLNGSGVGRAYDDQMIKVNWANQPRLIVAIDEAYADRQRTTPEWDAKAGAMIDAPMIPEGALTVDEAVAVQLGATDPVTWFTVPDSRAGWAKAVEELERMTYEGRSDETLVLDFSNVRPYGSPIMGMQGRPSSGPGPLMKALLKIAELRGANGDPWELAMLADHAVAECVVVGGARRAARMSTKTWRDAGIFDFITIKSRRDLWSSNNSVTIDEEFRERVVKVRELLRQGQPLRWSLATLEMDGHIDSQDAHAWRVLKALASEAYYGQKGEPGIINQDRLRANDEGIEAYLDGQFAGSRDYEVDARTLPLMKALAGATIRARYTMIVNPCGEIALLMLGGYCVIADVVPFHARNDNDAEEAFRVAVRALMRVNLMDSLYGREVRRTNRIGVGMTGFHEWAYARFGYTWHDLIDESRSAPFWALVARFRDAVADEARRYAKVLGVAVPHTFTTFKPAGTTSKLFGLTEGAHLPPMRWYVRWVQFRTDDPLVEQYRAKGYPVRETATYAGTSIVGFPTEPTICTMGDGEWVVTAPEATPEEQYQFLRLLETHWIGAEGNQVSYTLKYDPDVVGFEAFMDTLIDGQFSIRCCSVMPSTDPLKMGYEYLPEEPVSKAMFETIKAQIDATMAEDIGLEHVDCATGACPISFDEGAKEAA